MLLLLFAGAGTSTKKVVKGWIDEERKRLRNTIKARTFDKILAKQRSWPTDINKSYRRVQDNIDEIKELSPIVRATEELAWRIERRNEFLQKFADTNNDYYRREAEVIERRINELYTEIYRLKLIAELEQQKH
jgi:hypothetical protein